MKKPKFKINPETEKKPRTAPQNSPESIFIRNPSWRFGLLDKNGPWGWLNIQQKKLVEDILEKLKNFETMTWHEIDQNSNNHFMKLDNIDSKAQKRLREMKLDDIEYLYSIRLSNKERVWGKRHNEAFYIIWWDPEHTVYPVGKKHT